METAYSELVASYRARLGSEYRIGKGEIGLTQRRRGCAVCWIGAVKMA